jgi:predicted metalloprotease
MVNDIFSKLLRALFLVAAISAAMSISLANENRDQNSCADVANVESNQQSAEDIQLDFFRAILGSTEDVWTDLLKAESVMYFSTRLMIYDKEVRTGCGKIKGVDAFYCASDRTIFMARNFISLFAQKVGLPYEQGAPSIWQSLLIAHEVGHHIQKMISPADSYPSEMDNFFRKKKVERFFRDRENQADCFAGVWLHHANKNSGAIDHENDIRQGKAFFFAMGIDVLPVPQSVTSKNPAHGTSEERLSWFSVGYQTGNYRECKTFDGNLFASFR